MIGTDPQKLMNEMRAGVEKRDLYLRHEKELLARYHGPGYLPTAATFIDHENHAFEWIARYSAELVHSNPRATIAGYNDPASMAEAQPLEAAANQDIRRSDLRRLIQDTFPDWAMFWNITVTTIDPLVGEEHRDVALFGPNTEEVQRDDFWADASAKRWRNVRICGRRIVGDKEDLLKRAKDNPDEGWNVAAIAQMSPRGKIRSSGDDDEDRLDRALDRGEVEWHEIFIDEDDEDAYKRIDGSVFADNGDKLYNGTLCTIAVESVGADGKFSAHEIRQPRAYFGAPSDDSIKGPFVMHDCYRVPKHLYGLGPVLSVYHQNRKLNDHVDMMFEHSKNARAFSAIDGNNTDDNKKLKNAKHGDVLVVNGVTKDRKQDFVFPGITPEDLETYKLLLVRRNEAAGMSQSVRGNAVSGITATADAIAGDSSQARKEYCAQRLTDGWRAVIKQRVWFLRNDFRIIFHLDDGRLFLGGYDPEKALNYAHERGIVSDEELNIYTNPKVLDAMKQSRVPWSQLNIEIDIFSMQRTSADLQQRRLTDGGQLFLSAVQLMAQCPQVDWKAWLDKQGEGLNWPDYSKLLKPEVLQAMVQAAAEQQAAAQQGEQPVQGAVRSPQAAAAGGGGDAGSQQAQGGGLPGNRSGSTLGSRQKAGAR